MKPAPTLPREQLMDTCTEATASTGSQDESNESKKQRDEPKKLLLCATQISTKHVWPPSQHAREDIRNHVVEWLTSAPRSVPSQNYGAVVQQEDASSLARWIEEKSFAAASGELQQPTASASSSVVDATTIGSVYSRQIVERVRKTLKARLKALKRHKSALPTLLPFETVWPPSQLLRDAALKCLVEILTTSPIVSRRYEPTIPSDKAIQLGRQIEEQALFAASRFVAGVDGDEILEIYSRMMSKRLIEVVTKAGRSTQEKKKKDRHAVVDPGAVSGTSTSKPTSSNGCSSSVAVGSSEESVPVEKESPEKKSVGCLSLFDCWSSWGEKAD